MKKIMLLMLMMIVMSFGVSALGLEFEDVDEYNAFVNKWQSSSKAYGLKVTGVSDHAHNPTITVSFDVTISGTYFDAGINQSVTEEFDTVSHSVALDRTLSLAQMKQSLGFEGKRLVADWKAGTRYNANLVNLMNWEVVIQE